MAGFGYDTSTATIRVTLPDGEVVEVTGANDGVNGYDWSARIVGNDLRLNVTVVEHVLIDGITDELDDDDEPTERAKERATCSKCLARTYRSEECLCDGDEGDAEDYDAALADELGAAPIDRCESCGSDRGDGYCQECPDDPDRTYDKRSD